MQPAEMLAWLGQWSQASARALAGQLRALVKHFLTNAAQRQACPWARPGACAIYPQRFLACRAYGLWSSAAYESRRQAALARQEQVRAAWAGLGLTLPEEVLASGPDYCRSVQMAHDGENRPIGDHALEALEAETHRLTQDQPWTEELEACGGDISYLVARLALGERACLAAKVEVTRSLLTADGEQAAKLLNQASKQSANLAVSLKKLAW